MKKVFLLMMIAYYVIIIAMFSGQTAVESTSESHRITGAIYDKIIIYFGKQNEIVKENFINYADYFIRKCAHFGNFFILSLLITAFVNCFKNSYKKSFFITFSVCFMFAFFDEIHQLFVDGRSCQFTDMLIDSNGSTFGILISYIIINFKNQVFKI